MNRLICLFALLLPGCAHSPVAAPHPAAPAPIAAAPASAYNPIPPPINPYRNQYYWVRSSGPVEVVIKERGKPASDPMPERKGDHYTLPKRSILPCGDRAVAIRDRSGFFVPAGPVEFRLGDELMARCERDAWWVFNDPGGWRVLAWRPESHP
jgi:hypothetical protein